MPKKRNTSWSRSKKEKQIITARLIEISLRVDDYIYKQKLITVREAEQFIREVSSYKVQCCRDERSLQVIEKLTRCMRAIILDHQELTTENNTINNDYSITGCVVREASISPVYSISDEDRTQFSQRAEEANNKLEIIDLSNIADSDDSMHNTVTGAYAGSRFTVEVDIHKGISSLSLIDADEPNDMATSTEVNCSQSILNNFDGVVNMQQREINTTFQRVVGLVDNVTSNKKANVMQDIGYNSIDKTPKKKITPLIEPNKTVKTAIIPNKPIFICNTTNHLKFNTVIQNKKPLKIPNATNYRQTNTFNQTIYPATNNVSKNQRQTWFDTNRICTIPDSSHMASDPKHFTQTRQIYKDVIDVNQATVTKGTVNVNIPTNTFNTAEKDKQAIATGNLRAPLQNKGLIINTAVVQENTVTTKKKKKRGAKNKLTNEKQIKTHNKRVYRRNPKINKENTLTNTNKNKTVPIYNENVVDDLSWIENIRYVREIRIDENDPTFNFEESFWDNYYLPANWSENEFL